MSEKVPANVVFHNRCAQTQVALPLLADGISAVGARRKKVSPTEDPVRCPAVFPMLTPLQYWS